MEDPNFVLHIQRKFNYLQSIPGVFGPHPSSAGVGGRRRNWEGSPPAERGHWMAVAADADRPSRPSTHLPARSIDQFLSPRIGPDVWRLPMNTTDRTILGVKRPPDGETLSLNFKDYPYMSNVGFECRPECPSPPKAMNTGQGSPQGGASPTMPNLLPSMLSLQALLSKLPSVTPMEEEAKSGGGGGTTSPSTSSGFEQNFPTYNNKPLPVSRSMSKAGQEEDFPRAEQQQHEQGDIQSQDQQPAKYTPFLDTFDTLSDFSLQDALESGDSCNSFLNEIY